MKNRGAIDWDAPFYLQFITLLVGLIQLPRISPNVIAAGYLQKEKKYALRRHEIKAEC